MKIKKFFEKNWYSEKPHIWYQIVRESDNLPIFDGDLKTAINIYFRHKEDNEKCYILKKTIETITEEQLKIEIESNKYNL